METQLLSGLRKSTVATTPRKINNRPLWQLTEDEAVMFGRLTDLKTRLNEPHILWGWKRDQVVNRKRQPLSRTVYFSADLLLDQENKLTIARGYLFLDTRAETEQIQKLAVVLGKRRHLGDYPMKVRVWSDRRYLGFSRLRLEVGTPAPYDIKALRKRLRGRPRLAIAPPRIISETSSYDISGHAPFALCCGSGLSTEAGLPALGWIHNLFDVDNPETCSLIFGDSDGLPGRVVSDVDGEFAKYCQFTVDALKANPSPSYHLIADLYRKGIIKQVFTDNLDDLLAKVGVPHTPTRFGIFPPEVCPVELDPSIRGFLVVGVSVDRRKVIKQARQKGVKIIIVNPVLPVAPQSRNMDYPRRGDVFFRERAEAALPKIISASKF